MNCKKQLFIGFYMDDKCANFGNSKAGTNNDFSKLQKSLKYFEYFVLYIY